MVATAFYNCLFTLATSIALQSVITFSVGLTDTVMVDSLGLLL